MDKQVNPKVMGRMMIDGGDFHKLDIEFNNLSVFVGQNGSGKSFVLKSAWLTGYVLQAWKLFLDGGAGDIRERMLQFITDLIPMTFDAPETMSYEWQISDKERDIYELTFKIVDGKCTEFEMGMFKEFNAKDITVVKYASSTTRLLTAYRSYQETLELIGGNVFTDMEKLKKLGKFYKLYDIMMFENVSRVVKAIADCDKAVLESLEKTYKALNDMDEKVFGGKRVTVKDGIPYFGDKSVYILGNGEQAILMMYIFQLN
tara:strand:+ start:4003 stop:4779 length:777 start_codon:yes stop_codon:yes gene_type:complete